MGLRQVDVGNYVTAGDTSGIVITQTSPISVLFTLPEDDLGPLLQRASGRGPSRASRCSTRRTRPGSPRARWRRSTTRSTPAPAAR
ncbi:MAG: hypothetical protein U1E17_13430 [Geminicoccaceae bacterium]